MDPASHDATAVRPHFSQRYRRSSFPVSSGSLPSIFIVCLQSMQVIKSSNLFRSSFMCYEPEAKKTKSSSRLSVSNVMASVGPRDAVGPHANNSMQIGS
jgi:hypothetical protein